MKTDRTPSLRGKRARRYSSRPLTMTENGGDLSHFNQLCQLVHGILAVLMEEHNLLRAQQQV